MVGLAKQLMDILELRKAKFTGADIKLVTESILMAEASEQVKDGKEQAKINTDLMKEWMVGGETRVG